MAWWHRVGQKVVCINVDPNAFAVPGYPYSRRSVDGLNMGKVYTIEKVAKDDRPFHENATIFILAEIRRPGGFGFHCERFRPVVNRSSETGVAALKRHLVGAPVKEGVE